MIDIMTETISVKTFSGQWINGDYVKVPGPDVTVPASIQPMNANEVLILPEHRRSEQWIKVYTSLQLKETDERNNIPADEFEHDGKIFQVFRVADWAIGTDIPHYKALAVKKNDEGGGNVA